MTLTSIELPAGLTSVGEIAPQTRSHADDESEPAADARADAGVRRRLEADTLAVAPSLRIRGITVACDGAVTPSTASEMGDSAHEDDADDGVDEHDLFGSDQESEVPDESNQEPEPAAIAPAAAPVAAPPPKRRQPPLSAVFADILNNSANILETHNRRDRLTKREFLDLHDRRGAVDILVSGKRVRTEYVAVGDKAVGNDDPALRHPEEWQSFLGSNPCYGEVIHWDGEKPARVEYTYPHPRSGFTEYFGVKTSGVWGVVRVDGPGSFVVD